MAAPALKVGVVADVPLKALTPDPHNPRTVFDETSIAALAESIKARGVLQPLTVRKGDKGVIIVQDGHRRLRAAKLAKVKAVPVLLAVESDTAAVRLDQVAANQLHEQLAPMDLARTLRRLRDAEKLTPNDLAARMAKAGTPMSTKEIEASIAMTDLPDWAAGMIDAGELEPDAAAPILAAQKDAAIAKRLAPALRQAVGWNGTVNAQRAAAVVEDAYRGVGHNLAKNWDPGAVHFDWRVRCKGCESLRTLGGGSNRQAVCIDRKAFEKHNAEAKKAGLGIGGKISAKVAAAAPEKLTAAQKRKVEAEKTERREKMAAGRAASYLDTWLRARCAALIPNNNGVGSKLIVWMAAGRPDAGLIESRYVPREWDLVRTLPKAVACAGRLDAFLNGTGFAKDHLQSLAIAGLALMTPGQVRDVAAALGVSMQVDFKADEAYLALRTQEQLVEWLALYGLDQTGGAPKLRQRLLDHPHTLEFTPKLAHMKAMQDAYAAPVRDEDEAADDLREDEDDAEATEPKGVNGDAEDLAPVDAED